MIINDLSIIVLAKNEEKNLNYLLPKLKKMSNDIIVVDGKSRDNSKIICKKNKIKFRLDNGLGKGDAQRIGAKIAKKKYIIFFDGDRAHNINDIRKIRKKLNKYDLVICSRQTGGSYDLNINNTIISAIRASGCIFLTYLVNKFFKVKFTDVLYSFKGISKKNFLRLNTTSNSFEIELDILLRSIVKKIKIIEIPSRENARIYGKSKLKTIQGINFIFFVLFKKIVGF